MATTTNLGKVHVFPSEESYNTNKGSVGANDLALVPINVATTSKYGLVRFASESDVLSESGDATMNVPLAYELNDFRRISKAYSVGDKVNCAFKFEYFLECMQAGTTSAESLDTRNVTFGQVITDGTVQWTVRAHVKSVNNVVPDANGNIEVPQPDISGKINVSGARGNLAGYETPASATSTLTINADSMDSTYFYGAGTITVQNGAVNTTWTKTVALTNASAAVSLGTSWKWYGGVAPDIRANCVLVLHWCSTFGIVNLVVSR